MVKQRGDRTAKAESGPLAGALNALRAERSQRRKAEGKVTMAVSEAAASGKRVLEAKGAESAFDSLTIARDFSVVCKETVSVLSDRTRWKVR